MLITYKKLSLNQKSTYYYILCFFPIQFCVSLCIGCTGKRSGISVKGLRKFLSSEGICCLCVRCSYDYLTSNERLPQDSHAKVTRLSQDKTIRRTCPALQPCVLWHSCDSLAIQRTVTLLQSCG